MHSSLLNSIRVITEWNDRNDGRRNGSKSKFRRSSNDDDGENDGLKSKSL
jgi:hypothetical protein